MRFLAWVGRGYLLVAGTAVLLLVGMFLLLCAAGLLQDVVKDVRQWRARRRFTREALEQARLRLAERQARLAQLEAQAAAHAAAHRAEQDALWREIVSFPEWPSAGAGR